MKTKEEFEVFYSTKLQKAADLLEAHRLKQEKKIKRQFYWALSLLPLLVISVFTKHGFIIFLGTLPSAIFVLLAIDIYVKLNRYMVHNYKKYLLKPAIGFYFNDFQYIEKQKIAPEILIDSRLFPDSVNYIYGEDFMRFSLGKAQLMLCETDVYRGQRNKVFKGVFMSSSFNKFFKSETYVIARKSATFLQRIRKQLFKKLEEVHLESPEFMKIFQTLSADQVEARYSNLRSIIK